MLSKMFSKVMYFLGSGGVVLLILNNALGFTYSQETLTNNLLICISFLIIGIGYKVINGE